MLPVNIRKLVFILLFAQISMILNGQIIADHTVVDRFDDIPQKYIDEVKKMLLIVAGESHTNGYFEGLLLIISESHEIKTFNFCTATDDPLNSFL